MLRFILSNLKNMSRKDGNQLVAVLLLITSPGCGACVRFRQEQWTTLKKQLESGLGDRLVVEELDMTQNVAKEIMSGDPKYHKNLTNLIPHTPEFLLVPVDIWKNKREKLKAVAFNSKMIGENMIADRENLKSYTGYNIFFWIEETLKTHPLFQDDDDGEDDLIYIPVDTIPNLDEKFYDDNNGNNDNGNNSGNNGKTYYLGNKNNDVNTEEKKYRNRFKRNTNVDKFEAW
jgi:hypothetical protein